MTETATFDGAPPAGTINLGIGQPSMDLLPLNLLCKASDMYFQSAHALDLNYGTLSGDHRFLLALAGFLSREYDVPVDPGSLMVTAGVSQALDLVCTVFTKPGDTVFVEEPSYFLAFKIFEDHGLNIVGIPTDGDGLDVAYLSSKLSEVRPSLLYTIPGFQNPGGQCLSLDRRKALAALSKEHDFLIVADEVYQSLYYRERPPPAMATMIDKGQVVSLGSFSKILAPALRLGWLQTSRPYLDQLLSNGMVNSGASLNHYTSHIIRHAIDAGLLEQNILKLRSVLGDRLEAMDAALAKYLAGAVEWYKPDGGYFFWVRSKDGLDMGPLKRRAAKLETGFQPGNAFSSNGGFNSHFRLSFAPYDERDITEAVRRLAPLFPPS